MTPERRRQIEQQLSELTKSLASRERQISFSADPTEENKVTLERDGIKARIDKLNSELKELNLPPEYTQQLEQIINRTYILLDEYERRILAEQSPPLRDKYKFEWEQIWERIPLLENEIVQTAAFERQFYLAHWLETYNALLNVYAGGATRSTQEVIRSRYEQSVAFVKQRIEELKSAENKLSSTNDPKDSDNRRLSIALCHPYAYDPDAFPANLTELAERLENELRHELWHPGKFTPGLDRETEMLKKMDGVDVIIICFSKEALTKEGHFRVQIKQALKLKEKKHSETIFIIPIKLDECILDEQFENLGPPKFFGSEKEKTKGYNKLIAALKVRANQLDLSLISP